MPPKRSRTRKPLKPPIAVEALLATAGVLAAFGLTMAGTGIFLALTLEPEIQATGALYPPEVTKTLIATVAGGLATVLLAMLMGTLGSIATQQVRIHNLLQAQLEARATPDRPAEPVAPKTARRDPVLTLDDEAA